MSYTKPAHLISASIQSGKIEISTGDGRTFNLVRISDGMQLAQHCGSLSDAQARANQMIALGEV